MLGLSRSAKTALLVSYRRASIFLAWALSSLSRPAICNLFIDVACYHRFSPHKRQREIARHTQPQSSSHWTASAAAAYTMDRPRASQWTAIGTAAAAAAAAAIHLGVRIHREARNDQELVEEALREASEAEPRNFQKTQVAAGAAQSTSAAAGFVGRAQGRRRRLDWWEITCYRIIDQRGLAPGNTLKRGAIRTSLGHLLETVAKSCQIAGSTAIVVSATISFSLTRRVAARLLKAPASEDALDVHVRRSVRGRVRGIGPGPP